MNRWVRSEPVRGQALVEFALAITVFLLLMMAIVDFGRGIYMYNGVSQAAGDRPDDQRASRCSARREH